MILYAIMADLSTMFSLCCFNFLPFHSLSPFPAFLPFIFTTFCILFIALSALYLHCLLCTACISPFHYHLAHFFTILFPPFSLPLPHFVSFLPLFSPSFYRLSFLPSTLPSLFLLLGSAFFHPLSLLTASLYV